jgi:hypothetical protein
MFAPRMARVCIGASVVAVGSAIVYRYYMTHQGCQRESCTIFGVMLGLEEIMSRMQASLVEEEQKLRDLELEVGGTPGQPKVGGAARRSRRSILERISLLFDPSMTKIHAERVSELNNSFGRLAGQVDAVALSVFDTNKGPDARKLQLQTKQLTKRLEVDMEQCDLLEKTISVRVSAKSVSRSQPKTSRSQ